MEDLYEDLENYAVINNTTEDVSDFSAKFFTSFHTFPIFVFYFSIRGSNNNNKSNDSNILLNIVIFLIYKLWQCRESSGSPGHLNCKLKYL